MSLNKVEHLIDKSDCCPAELANKEDSCISGTDNGSRLYSHSPDHNNMGRGQPPFPLLWGNTFYSKLREICKPRTWTISRSCQIETFRDLMKKCLPYGPPYKRHEKNLSYFFQIWNKTQGYLFSSLIQLVVVCEWRAPPLSPSLLQVSMAPPGHVPSTCPNEVTLKSPPPPPARASVHYHWMSPSCAGLPCRAFPFRLSKDSFIMVERFFFNNQCPRCTLH